VLFLNRSIILSLPTPEMVIVRINARKHVWQRLLRYVYLYNQLQRRGRYTCRKSLRLPIYACRCTQVRGIFAKTGGSYSLSRTTADNLVQAFALRIIVQP
jgi:hypothetical protein